MKKRILNVLFVLYVIIAIFVTVCLLSYNKFKVSEFGNYSFVIISDNEVEPDFKKGDLVIVNKKSKVLTGKKAFFYNTYEKDIEISLGTVDAIEKVNESENTYTMEGEHKISGQYVLGPAETASVVPFVGNILGVLESKWGFLFLIVLPSLLAFIYQITVVVEEIKKKDDNKGKENSNEK